jgi:hypothetical protein
MFAEYHKETHEYRGIEIEITVRERLGEGVDVCAKTFYNEDEENPRVICNDGSFLKRILHKYRGKDLRDRIEEVKEASENWIDQAKEIEEQAKGDENGR